MKEVIAIAFGVYGLLVAFTFAGATLENANENFLGFPTEEVEEVRN